MRQKVPVSGTDKTTLRVGGGGTESATRVADVLGAFIDGPTTLGVSEIARSLALSKAVVHRILRSLLEREFLSVADDGRTYRLGPAAVALGGRAFADSDLRAAALPVLHELRDATRETTTASQRRQDSRVYVTEVVSPQEIKMTVALGERQPLHAGSSGKAILAFLPPGDRERILSKPLERLTDATIVDPDELRAELERIREASFAVSLGERQGDAASVASPVIGVHGEAIGALSVCGPIHRFDAAAIERYSVAVRAAAAAVSASLRGARR